MKRYAIGFVVGALAATLVFYLFGQDILGGVAQTTRQAGEQVEKVGKKLKESGDDIE